MRSLQIALFLLVLTNAVYYVLTLVCMLMFAGRKEPQAADIPTVSVLKAVKGLDPGAAGALESFLTQDYRGPYRVVFTLADPDDPALPLLRRLAADHPEREVRIVVARERLGPNEKMSNLAQAMEEADGELIALADADVLARPDWLRRMSAPFSEPRVGLTTCLYRAAGGQQNLWSRLEGLTIASDLMPQVMVAERLEGLSFALGASICVRRSALERIGGFAALADYLADDYLLGNRIAGAGWRLVLLPQVVDLVFGRQRPRDYFLHQLRWARTYRACRPAGWAATAITHAVLWGPLFAAASGFTAAGWAAMGGLALLRAAVFLTSDRLFLKGGRAAADLALLPVKDLLAFTVFVASFAGRRVRWREKVFRLDAQGRLTAP